MWDVGQLRAMSRSSSAKEPKDETEKEVVVEEVRCEAVNYGHSNCANVH